MGGDDLLVALLEGAGPGRVARRLGLGRGPLGIGTGVGVDLEGLCLGRCQRRLAVCVSFGLELSLVTVGLGQGALPVGLGVSGTANLGFEPLGGQVGLTVGEGGLRFDYLLRRLGLGCRPGLRGPGIGLFGFGEEPGTFDRGVPGVLGCLLYTSPSPRDCS